MKNLTQRLRSAAKSVWAFLNSDYRLTFEVKRIPPREDIA